MSHETMISEFAAKNDNEKRNVLYAAENYAADKKMKDEVLDEMPNDGKGHDVLFISGDSIAIVERYETLATFNCTYTASVRDIDGLWRPINQYFTTEERAFLGALGYKYDGANSKFHHYAAKMILPKED